MISFLKTLFTSNKKLSTDQVIRKRTIISFAVFMLFAVTGLRSWKWLKDMPAENGEQGGIQQPLRNGLKANEQIFGKLFSGSRTSKSYPESLAVKRVRVNGNIGLGKFDTASWRLQVVRAPGDTLRLTLDDIRKLPKTDVVFDFKCIEGWDQVTHWAGVRFSDFVKAYGLSSQTDKDYAGLVTPDRAYYVGIDMPSMLQQQTILCYEMNGKPLPLNQGYPLRLIIPVKYGIKHLKRIGVLYFDNKKPPDYWAERGYDYYSGL